MEYNFNELEFYLSIENPSLDLTDIFKQSFHGMIDSDISNIFINKKDLLIVKSRGRDHSYDSYIIHNYPSYLLDPDIILSKYDNILTEHEHIYFRQNENSEYSKYLDNFDIENFKSSNAIKSFIQEYLKEIDVGIFKEVKLFGEHEYFYELYRTHHAYRKLSDEYYDLINAHKDSVIDLIEKLKSVSSESAIQFMDEIFIKIKQQLKNTAHYGDFSETVNNRWSEVGYLAVKEIFFDNIYNDIYYLVDQEFSLLTPVQKLILEVDNFCINYIDVEYGQIINFDQVFNADIHELLKQITASLISEAKNEWLKFNDY